MTWHVWDHAEGMGFASRTEAESCFKEYRDKVSDYATRLYDADMKVLEQYGSMDFYDWDELRAWAEEFFTGGGDDYNPDDHVLCPGVIDRRMA